MSSGEYGQADGAGRLLAGRYRAVAQLGRGGMGVVWRAVDEVLGREVAVKELRTYTDADGPELADLRVRMQREARAAARVRHPGVVAVHDVAEVDGRPLIVMELVDGPSLDDVLREHGTIDPREAAGIGAKVMEALAAAHRAGVLHRDVKPGNILLERSGRVVLTDFGIATMEDPGDGSATHLTRSGELVGSLDYLAPERAQGADPGPASDVWALGATLYAAVEGVSPFRRTSTYSTLTAIVSEPLPEPRRAGPLGPVLQLLLDKRPEGRPEADAARELLQRVADGSGTDVPTTMLRGSGAPREETQRSVPAVPPGFGPPESGASAAQRADASERSGQEGPAGSEAPVFGSPVQAGPGTPGFGSPERADSSTPGFGSPVQDGSSAPGSGSAAAAAQASAATGPIPASPPSRRKGRVLLAAAAVTVVLAATGVTVALLNNTGDAEAGARPTSSATTSGGATSSASGSPDADRSASANPTEQGDEKTRTPTTPPPEKGEGTSGGQGSTPTPTKSAGGGTTEGGSSSGGASGGGGATTPAPTAACVSIGGGKYNCEVWRTATSYTADGTKAGVLNAGTNYFYCQSNLGRRETYGEWTNVWWAKTDDDRGNAGVYISDVYIKGGNNDEPVPGLPAC
ncbi:protein kinase [Streptomyces sp. DG2A-72]|uniref:serine/threonine-protein kinase n=1 Tax=Streptomyces sp. DG2A-72 TaxID=3051386 RepID=UPI00265C65D8|nr:serine/threonine-protein kinase [Streptomyces sp. DG2A-72]MDO0931024.1 protein kinase [Streptomyces sp. DG2A-72]